MTNLVPPTEIENIVGTTRREDEHWGRAVSAEETVYILHSASCLASGIDLRGCEFSVALDDGIELGDWEGSEDQPVRLEVEDGWLMPKV